MRALLLVATLSAIGALSSCAVPRSQPPGANPTPEASSTAVVPPAPPAATASPVEPGESKSPVAAAPAAPQPAASIPPSSEPPASGAPTRTTPSGGGSPSTAKPPLAAAAPPEPAASPTLDLDGLEQRLRDTHAIGMLTKLSLKNQVNDLLDQFRGFHDGHLQVPLADLRQRYEQLLLKVVTLLQDSDEPLAKAVASSREAIWGILANPKTFTESRATTSPPRRAAPTATASPPARTATAATLS